MLTFSLAACSGEEKTDNQSSEEIVAPHATISASQDHTVGLKTDGTAVAVGDNHSGQCDVSGWKNIKQPK